MLQPEISLHNEIKRKLEEIGWKNGHEILNFLENDVVSNFYFERYFKKKILELNEFLKELGEDERRDALEQIRKELESADEKRILRFLRHGIWISIGVHKTLPRSMQFLLLHRAFSGHRRNWGRKRKPLRHFCI